MLLLVRPFCLGSFGSERYSQIVSRMAITWFILVPSSASDRQVGAAIPIHERSCAFNNSKSVPGELPEVIELGLTS
jgi:hypothetical protein